MTPEIAFKVRKLLKSQQLLIEKTLNTVNTDSDEVDVDLETLKMCEIQAIVLKDEVSTLLEEMDEILAIY